MRRIHAGELPGTPLARTVLARFCSEARRLAPDKVERIIVYGSMARGDAGPESDLDIWVDWNGDEHQGQAILGDLGARMFLETGVLVSVHVVDAAHRERLEAHDALFYRNVKAEGLLVEG